MPPSNTQSSQGFKDVVARVKPSLAFVVIIFCALIAFEIFNFSTTEHALRDLLGDLKFAGILWSTVLAIAFCSIDFAGIARLFTPEQGAEEPKEVWYLFGAWLLAATMNAILTWWGVSMAVTTHNVQSASVINPETITTIVPVFVAIMVWVIRILIIGTLSLAMDRMMHPAAERRQAVSSTQSTAVAASRPSRSPVQTTAQPMSVPASLNSSAVSQRPSTTPRAVSASSSSRSSRSTPVMDEPEYLPDTRSSREPTYHSLSMSSRPPVNNNTRK